MDTKPTDIDSYLATVPEDARKTLEGLRRTIRSLAPDAVESISYGLPTFKYHGKPLIHFGAAKNHCAVYGGQIDAFREQLADYDTSKGALRFPPNAPPPDAVVQSLVTVRMTQIDRELTSRKRKKSS